jgi:NAD(P)-dependent dehydrogenase (short-subunit alcohol dehydrogenase family)
MRDKFWKVRAIDILVNNAALKRYVRKSKAASEQSKFEYYPLEFGKISRCEFKGVFLCSQISVTKW